MAKKKGGRKKLQDLQYSQIISRSRPEAEDLLRKLGLLAPSPVEESYSRRMSAQAALMREDVDMASSFLKNLEQKQRYGRIFSAPDLSQLNDKERIIAYYARPDVQREMYRFAKGRYLTVLRSFSPMFSKLSDPEDILLLMFHYLKSKGNRWPSMHGTISRYNERNKRVCDFVFEPDYKKNWAVAFGAARPIVKLFTSMGLPFFIKYSGNSSPHIIIPAEALAAADDRHMKKHEFREAVYTFVMSRMHKPGLLDGRTWQPDHFIRLAYSIHELGGKVSMPIKPEEFDSFNPDKARIENMQVIENWWSIPADAAERGKEFVQQVLRNYPLLVSGMDKAKPRHEWKAPAVPRKLRQVFDVNWYAKVLANGQQLLASAEGTAIPDAVSHQSSREEEKASEEAPNGSMAEALNMLEHWKSAGLRIDLMAAADVFEVDLVDLQRRWQRRNALDYGRSAPRLPDNQALIEPAIEYYSRKEIQEAFYQYAAGRCFRAPGSRAHFRLRQPSDIPPLAKFFRSSNKKWRGFECTRSIYDPADNQIVACDIGMEIDFSRSDYVSAVELAGVLMEVLLKYEVYCFVKFDGKEILELVIPAEALPRQVDGQPTALQIYQIASGLNRGFRKMPEVSGNDCALIIQPYGYTRPAYSINPETGLACIVLMPGDLQEFLPESANPERVMVNKSWFDMPDCGRLNAQRFLKYALSPKWHPTSD